MGIEVTRDPGESQYKTPAFPDFYHEAPDVFIEATTNSSTGTYTRSIGGYSAATSASIRSADTFSVSTTGDDYTVYAASITSAYPDRPAYVWLVKGATSARVSVSNSTQHPKGVFWVEDANYAGVPVTGYYGLPKEGWFCLSGLAGWSSSSARALGVARVEFRFDGKTCIDCWANPSGTFTYITNGVEMPGYAEAQFKCLYYERARYLKRPFYYVSPNSTLTETYNYLSGRFEESECRKIFECYAGDLYVEYNQSDIPDNAQSLQVVITSQNGLTRTYRYSMKKERFFPMIDRLSVNTDETTSARVVGNFITDATLRGAQFTTDRRVPLLHLPFNGYVSSLDGDGPRDRHGTATYITSPWAGTSGVSLGAGELLEYSSEFFNPMAGTVECWWKPTANLSTTDMYLFWVGNYGVNHTIDRMGVYADSSRIAGRVMDSMGVEHIVSAAASFSTGYWYHITFKWELNQSNDSRMYVKWRRYGTTTSGAGSLTGQTILWSMLPSKDLRTALDSDDTEMTANYSNIYVGGTPWSSGYSGNCGLSDFRLTDCWSYEDHSGDTERSGWRSSNSDITMSVNAETNMFSLARTSPMSSGEVQVVKIRGYTLNKPKSSFYNTPSCKPILLRGPWTGVDAGGGTLVERFRFIDAEGIFPDYTLSVNPSSFSVTLGDGTMVKEVSSINGKRILSTYKLPADSVTMTWDNCTRTQMLEIKERALSTNSFFLIDHNNEFYFGKMQVESVEEIVATVPSRYRVSVKFIGQGGRDDYSMA